MSEDARDLIEQDLARHERMVGREVAASRNQTLAAEALEIAARHAVLAPAVAAPVAAPVEQSTEKRELNGHTYVIDKSAEDDSVFRQTTEFERNVLAHAQPRIQLLLTKEDDGPLGQPSWRMRTMAALYFKIKSLEAQQSGKVDESRVFERAFQQDLYELLEASNQPFGDWRKDAPEKLIVTVSR